MSGANLHELPLEVGVGGKRLQLDEVIQVNDPVVA